MNLLRSVRLTALLGLGCLLLASLKIGQAQFPVDDPKEACSIKHLKDAVRVDQYLFRTYQSGDGTGCFQVSHDKKILFRRTNDNGGWFFLGQPVGKEDKVPAIPNGTDVTGRGNPDMVVVAFSGGAHCCMFHYVFELEPKFRLLATIYDADDDLSHFELRGGDQGYSFVTADWTFAYWNGSFAGSPSHSVILRYAEDSKGGGFHLALDKMQVPPPTTEEWRNALSNVRGELQNEQNKMFNALPNVLWQEVLDLIYTGHSDLAWKFLDEVGPNAQKGNLPDLESFCSKLNTSPYWPDLAPTLINTPPACVNAKPRR